MERYLFFNSAPGDPRVYQASDFADYFGSVLSTGLLHTDYEAGMSVSVVTGTLNTVVSSGKAIMDGHWYENTSDLTLSHSIPEATLSRIDRIVLRLDLRNSSRSIHLAVKEGTAASTPVPPTLQRDNFIYELSLAQILVRANTSQLLQSDLVDERLNEELCGYSYSLISIPTEQFEIEWNVFMENVQKDGFLPLAGGNMTGAISRRYAGTGGGVGLKIYRNVVGNYISNTVSGALKITIPKSWSATSMNIRLTGRNTVSGAVAQVWDLMLSVYSNNANGGYWQNPIAILTGEAPYSSVTFGHDGTNSCILLGGVNTTWSAASIELYSLEVSGYTTDGWETGWDISLITDISDITKAVQPTVQKLATQTSVNTAMNQNSIYGTTTNSGNAYAVTVGSSVTTLVPGLTVRVKTNANSTAAPTVNVNGLGAKSVLKPNGNVASFKAGGVYTLVYDGVSAFILQGEGGEYGTAGPGQVLEGYTLATEYDGIVPGTLVAKKYASGTIPNKAANSGDIVISGAGIGFVPNLVIVRMYVNSQTTVTNFLVRRSSIYYPGRPLPSGTIRNDQNGAMVASSSSTDVVGGVVSTSGIDDTTGTITVSNYNNYSRTNITWYAYE